MDVAVVLSAVPVTIGLVVLALGLGLPSIYQAPAVVAIDGRIPGGTVVSDALGRARYERKALILTSHRALDAWPEAVGNPLLASAARDRLTYPCHTLLIPGQSYRQHGRRTEHLTDHTATGEPPTDGSTLDPWAYTTVNMRGLQRPAIDSHFARDSLAATEGLPTAGGNGHLRRQTDALSPLIPATVEQLQPK